MKPNIFFVVSLPRTGTRSLCEMAQMCNLNPLHVLYKVRNYQNAPFSDIIKNGVNFFSDTPFYNHYFLNSIIEYGIQEQFNIKFIYSIRAYWGWKKSFDKMINDEWRPKNKYKVLSRIDYLDYINYQYIYQYYHNTDDHLKDIQLVSEIYNIPILLYSFDVGWEPFCDFIEKPIPKTGIPHIKVSV